MPTISIKGKNMPESPIRKLVPYAENAKKRGIEVFYSDYSTANKMKILPTNNSIMNP